MTETIPSTAPTNTTTNHKTTGTLNAPQIGRTQNKQTDTLSLTSSQSHHSMREYATTENISDISSIHNKPKTSTLLEKLLLSLETSMQGSYPVLFQEKYEQALQIKQKDLITREVTQKKLQFKTHIITLGKIKDHLPIKDEGIHGGFVTRYLNCYDQNKLDTEQQEITYKDIDYYFILSKNEINIPINENEETTFKKLILSGLFKVETESINDIENEFFKHIDEKSYSKLDEKKFLIKIKGSPPVDLLFSFEALNDKVDFVHNMGHVSVTKQLYLSPVSPEINRWLRNEKLLIIFKPDKLGTRYSAVRSRQSEWENVSSCTPDMLNDYYEYNKRDPFITEELDASVTPHIINQQTTSQKQTLPIFTKKLGSSVTPQTIIQKAINQEQKKIINIGLLSQWLQTGGKAHELSRLALTIPELQTKLLDAIQRNIAQQNKQKSRKLSLINPKTNKEILTPDQKNKPHSPKEINSSLFNNKATLLEALIKITNNDTITHTHPTETNSDLHYILASELPTVLAQYFQKETDPNHDQKDKILQTLRKIASPPMIKAKKLIIIIKTIKEKIKEHGIDRETTEKLFILKPAILHYKGEVLTNYVNAILAAITKIKSTQPQQYTSTPKLSGKIWQELNALFWLDWLSIHEQFPEGTLNKLIIRVVEKLKNQGNNPIKKDELKKVLRLINTKPDDSFELLKLLIRQPKSMQNANQNQYDALLSILSTIYPACEFIICAAKSGWLLQMLDLFNKNISSTESQLAQTNKNTNSNPMFLKLLSFWLEPGHHSAWTNYQELLSTIWEKFNIILNQIEFNGQFSSKLKNKILINLSTLLNSKTKNYEALLNQAYHSALQNIEQFKADSITETLILLKTIKLLLKNTSYTLRDQYLTYSKDIIKALEKQKIQITEHANAGEETQTFRFFKFISESSEKKPKVLIHLHKKAALYSEQEIEYLLENKLYEQVFLLLKQLRKKENKKTIQLEKNILELHLAADHFSITDIALGSFISDFSVWQNTSYITEDLCIETAKKIYYFSGYQHKEFETILRKILSSIKIKEIKKWSLWAQEHLSLKLTKSEKLKFFNEFQKHLNLDLYYSFISHLFQIFFISEPHTAGSNSIFPEIFDLCTNKLTLREKYDLAFTWTQGTNEIEKDKFSHLIDLYMALMFNKENNLHEESKNGNSHELLNTLSNLSKEKISLIYNQYYKLTDSYLHLKTSALMVYLRTLADSAIESNNEKQIAQLSELLIKIIKKGSGNEVILQHIYNSKIWESLKNFDDKRTFFIACNLTLQENSPLIVIDYIKLCLQEYSKAGLEHKKKIIAELTKTFGKTISLDSENFKNFSEGLSLLLFSRLNDFMHNITDQKLKNLIEYWLTNLNNNPARNNTIQPLNLTGYAQQIFNKITFMVSNNYWFKQANEKIKPMIIQLPNNLNYCFDLEKIQSLFKDLSISKEFSGFDLFEYCYEFHIEFIWRLERVYNQCLPTSPEEYRPLIPKEIEDFYQNGQTETQIITPDRSALFTSLQNIIPEVSNIAIKRIEEHFFINKRIPYTIRSNLTSIMQENFKVFKRKMITISRK